MAADLGTPRGGSIGELARASTYSSSYVSSLLGARLSSRGSLVEAESSTVHAALLLTDIEGFTSRVEQLCSAGPEGLDELARCLNSYFVELAETVYGHGGDVLAVTGDAFLCCWLADNPSDLAVPTARAAQAALAFQEGVERRASPGGEPLLTRIGISAGELEVAFVGGVNGRWELLPGGDPLDEVAAAEPAAPAGGVVLARSAWERVAGIAQGAALEEEEDALVRLTAVDAPGRGRGSAGRDLDIGSDLIGPFVPAPLRGWRASTGTEWLAELRRLTLVMTRLLDDSGEPLGIKRLQLAVRTFQETIARFEGASKAGTDNKGLTLAAAFGLPPRAHEDDPERALRAATAVRGRFEELELPCSVGVASGRAFCGLFGNDLRREYMVHGDVANLTARLAFAGDGDILCDEVTARSVPERFRFEALDPIAVKGRAGPIPIRRFVEMGARAAPRHSVLVDRAEERAILAKHLQLMAEDGERGVIVLEGNAGIGKSALVAEAGRLAGASGVRVLTAAADAVERTTGYYAWRPVFADVLGLEGDSLDPAALERLVLERIGGAPEIERLTPLLASVLPVTIPDNETTVAMRGDVRADNTTLLLTRLLSRLTTTAPVLLVVEDAHWLDSNSWSLLHEVVRSVPRLLALVTARPAAEDSEEYGALIELSSTAPLRLSSLTAEHTAALVCRRLGVEEVPPDLSRFVEERVAGHPFFCEALVKTMQEEGIVRVQDGTTVVGDLAGLEMPSTVEGAVLSLVDRLTPQQQLSLRVAAVVGRTFSARGVAEVHPVRSERSSVADDLRALVALDLLVPEDDEAETTYSFPHEITRDVAYGLLTESQRRPLHRAVAEWYERPYPPDELDPHHALLAHHWAQADDAGKAIGYLEKAGRQALRGGAFREAAHFYAQLLEQGDEMPDERRALWQKGEATAHYFLGDFDRSRMLLERAVARLDREIPKGGAAMARGLLGTGARQLAHLAVPGRYRDRRRGEKGLLDEAVECYKTLVQISYLNGESPAELVYLQFAGLNVGEEAGSSPHLARALANAAALASIGNLRRLADRYSDRAVRMADHEGQSEALAYVWNIHGLMQAQRGRWRRGIAANDRALELFGEIGDYNLEAELWQTRSALHLCAGDFRGAEACWTRTRELAARNSNPQLECWSLLDEVQSQVGRGATDAAAKALAGALAIETAESDGGTLIEKHYATAATRLLEGRRDEALLAADAVIDMITAQVPTGFVWADFAAGAVDLYTDMLEEGPAAGRLELLGRAERGCKVLRRTAWTFHGIRPRRLLLLGRLAWERGERERAVRMWRKAESAALAMDMDYDVARARLELARHDAVGGRDTLLADAIGTFTRLGADRQLRIAREA
jgi:class 3 adenylate cyclase/tetratricopeptide (TPR) repeat protein